MYATDDQITDVNNNDKDNEESVHYQDLDNTFQSANCLNLNNFISDNAKNNAYVIIWKKKLILLPRKN